MWRNWNNNANYSTTSSVRMFAFRFRLQTLVVLAQRVSRFSCRSKFHRFTQTCFCCDKKLTFIGSLVDRPRDAVTSDFELFKHARLMSRTYVKIFEFPHSISSRFDNKTSKFSVNDLFSKLHKTLQWLFVCLCFSFECQIIHFMTRNKKLFCSFKFSFIKHEKRRSSSSWSVDCFCSLPR